MIGHRTAELRSLAYHRAIADRIRADRSVLEAARQRVSGWRQSSTVHARYVEAWCRLLELPIDALVIRLVDDSEHMRDLRQVSPFAGALDARTRWRIWRSVA